MRRGFGAANTVATKGGRAYLTQQTQGPFEGHLSFFPFISRETFAVLGGNDPGEFAVKETVGWAHPSSGLVQLGHLSSAVNVTVKGKDV